MPEKKETPKFTALQYIRTIYLSLGAIIGLICFIIGATGGIKLILNHWFPVDNYYGYYSPYEVTPCESPKITYDESGKQVSSTPRTKEEIALCEKKTAENQEKQKVSDFNRELTEAIALSFVGFPVWLLHFWVMQQDWKKRREE